MRCTRVRRAHHKLKLVGSGDDRVGRLEGRLDDQAVPHAERQQILDRDRPSCGDGVVERPVDPLQHPAVGQLREEPVDRIFNGERALFNKEHRRGREDRLRHRGDTKDRVAPHRLAAAERHHTDRIDVNVLAAGNERDDARQFAVRDASGHRVMKAIEACLRRGTNHPHKD